MFFFYVSIFTFSNTGETLESINIRVLSSDLAMQFFSTKGHNDPRTKETTEVTIDTIPRGFRGAFKVCFQERIVGELSGALLLSALSLTSTISLGTMCDYRYTRRTSFRKFD